MRYNIELSKLLSDNPNFKADYDVFVNQEPPPLVAKYLRQRLGIGYKRNDLNICLYISMKLVKLYKLKET